MTIPDTHEADRYTSLPPGWVHQIPVAQTYAVGQLPPQVTMTTKLGTTPDTPTLRCLATTLTLTCELPAGHGWHRDGAATWYDRAPDSLLAETDVLKTELAAARAEVERLTQDRDTYEQERAKLNRTIGTLAGDVACRDARDMRDQRDQRDEVWGDVRSLRAERDAMRPVVEAVGVWRAILHPDLLMVCNLDAIERAVLEAWDTYAGNQTAEAGR